jgi:hypothetical protein
MLHQGLGATCKSSFRKRKKWLARGGIVIFYDPAS